jgi:phosphate starvation-inducible PhoH-like protein
LNLSEKKIEIKGVNPVEVLGVNNLNLKRLAAFFPTLKVTARGNEMTVIGEGALIQRFEEKFNLIVQHYHKYNLVTENDIANLLSDEGEKMIGKIHDAEIIVHGNGGLKVRARTINQKLWCKLSIKTTWFLPLVQLEQVKPILLLLWLFVR